MLLGGAARAEDIVRVAVDTEFRPVLEELIALYAQSHSTRFVIVDGVSAALREQIETQPLFDLFLSADIAHPERLEKKGAAVVETRRTYAIERPVVWKGQPVFLSKIRQYERAAGRSFAAEILTLQPDPASSLERQMVLLGPSVNNVAARDFWTFIQSEAAQRIIAAAGYQSPTWIDPNCHGCRREDALQLR